MHRLFFSAALLLSAALCVAPGSAYAQQDPAIDVLILHGEDSEFHRGIASAIVAELDAISGLGASWNVSVRYVSPSGDEIQQLETSESDILVSIGSSLTSAIERRSVNATHIGAGAIYPPLLEIPWDESTETSGTPDFTYVWPRRDLDAEIRAMRTLTDVNTILFIAPEHMPQRGDVIDRVVRHLQDNYHVDAVLRAVNASDFEEVAQTCDFAYLTGALAEDPETWSRIIHRLNARQVPTMAATRTGVEAGALISLYRPETVSVIVRRIAVRVQQASAGISLADKESAIDSNVDMSINLETAHALGIRPSFAQLLGASTVGGLSDTSGEALSLNELVDAALEQNLGFASQQRTAEEAFEAIKQARARLMPQLDFDISGVLIDTDRARASLGQTAQFTITPSLTLQQVIWSEPAYAALDAQRAAALAAQAELEAFRLDLIDQAIASYIGIAQLDANIEQINRSIERLNTQLDSAEQRRNVGTAGPADVYRLQSELASAQAQLVDLHVLRAEAAVRLNTLLNEPPSREVHVDTGLESNFGAYGLSDGERDEVIDPWTLTEVRDVLTGLALQYAPEMRQLQAALDAQERVTRSAARSYWNPTVALQGQLSNTGARFGVGEERGVSIPVPPESELAALASVFTTPDSWDWSLGVNINVPISRGGARLSESRVAQSQLATIETRLRDVQNQIALRVHNAANSLAGARLGVDLTETQVRAAQQTVNLVSSAYAEGVATVVDVVDAETALRLAEVNHTVAFYRMVQADFSLQRALGLYVRDLSEDELDTIFSEVSRILDGRPSSTGGGQQTPRSNP